MPAPPGSGAAKRAPGSVAGIEAGAGAAKLPFGIPGSGGRPRSGARPSVGCGGLVPSVGGARTIFCNCCPAASRGSTAALPTGRSRFISSATWAESPGRAGSACGFAIAGGIAAATRSNGFEANVFVAGGFAAGAGVRVGIDGTGCAIVWARPCGPSGFAACGSRLIGEPDWGGPD